jgi:uncharacterized protein YbcI
MEAHGEQLTGGPLNRAVASGIVRLQSDFVGRGPSRAHAFHSGNVFVVMMEDAMTVAEQSLVAGGHNASVLGTRALYQDAMGRDLSDVVERLTGCKVDAFMSANHIGPDLACECFVLDRDVPGGGGLLGGAHETG